MIYIVFVVVLIIGILVMIASYIKTPDVKNYRPSNKLVNSDVSFEEAMSNIKLVNQINIKCGDDNN